MHLTDFFRCPPFNTDVFGPHDTVSREERVKQDNEHDSAYFMSCKISDDIKHVKTCLLSLLVLLQTDEGKHENIYDCTVCIVM